MISNPDSPQPIAPDAYTRLGSMIGEAGRAVASEIRHSGLYTYYANVWPTFPITLRNEVRGAVNAYNDPPEQTGYKPILHPFSLAAEQGLTTGTDLARHTLPPGGEFDKFAKRLAGQLRALRVLLPPTAYDLSDIVRQSGSSVARHFKTVISPDLVTLDCLSDEDIELRRQEVYANSVGYVGASLVTKLVELEIRSSQPQGPQEQQARFEIMDDLDQMTGSEFTLKTNDF